MASGKDKEFGQGRAARPPWWVGRQKAYVVTVIDRGQYLAVWKGLSWMVVRRIYIALYED